MKGQTAATATGVFLLFVLTGGLWVGLAQLIPLGVPHTVLVISLAVFVAGIFLWLLISRVRIVLRGTPHLLRHLLVAALDVALLLAAFAAVYQNLGIVDTTMDGSPVVHSFLKSLYYSVVTFTTVGYGDFYPVGPGRALAGIQAFIGYLVLGVLASTAANILSPESRAGWGKEDDGDTDRG